MLFMRVIFFIGLIFLLEGCFMKSQETPPSWYAKSTTDESKLVGFGNAKTLENAKANALGDITTQLNVWVDSQFASQTQRQDSQIKYTSSNDISLKSSDIQLNNVKYTQSTFANNQFYVQAEVTKAALISQFQKEYNDTYTMLNSTIFHSLNKCSTLSIKDKTWLDNTLQKLRFYNTLLQILGSKGRALDKFEAILYANTPLPSAKLSITSNIASDKVSNNLAKELGYFYHLQNNATHTLKAEVSLSNIGEQHAKIDILFSILDCQQNPIFNTNVSYEATKKKDPISFASQRVSVQLYKKIQEWIEN